MTMHLAFFLFALCMLRLDLTCHAQPVNANAVYDFTRGDKVIFADNFRGDNIKSFPSNWQIATSTEQQYYSSRRSWTIEKEDGEVSLRSGTTFVHISPIIKSRHYPTDSFTVEFDCVFEDPAACAELYFTSAAQTSTSKEVCFHILSWGKINVVYPGNENRYVADFPGDFDYTRWHHFELSYCNRKIKCYLDGLGVMKIPDCGFSPISLSLGCIAPVRYGHFIVTHLNTSSINDLLMGKKFATHAIHFDNDRAVMKPESMGIITQIIAFLRAYPTIKLEIDGHTDNAGDDAHNIDLSIARAEEVKKQLIDGGIDESRLIARGLGASKPVRPNTTEENKSENRRVEFIRL